MEFFIHKLTCTGFFFFTQNVSMTTVVKGFNSSLERILQNTLINNAGRLIFTGGKKQKTNNFCSLSFVSVS